MKMATEIRIILTVDYEVFGDGSGQVAPCVLKPTERITEVAERYGAPVTFFVEALEFMSFEQAGSGAGIRFQLQDLLRRGHDLQLHMHPQWGNAKLGEDGNWRLALEQWRIGDLPRDAVFDMASKSIGWINTLAREARSNYSCNTFRAGGWAIQPSIHLLSALSELGIRIDSSVAPGMYASLPGEWFDFRKAPSLPFWSIENDVCISGGDGKLLEVPIATATIGKAAHFKALMANRSRGSGLAPECVGSYAGPNGLSWRRVESIRKLMRLGHTMLDFSTMPGSVLVSIVKDWVEKYSNVPSLPIVAIGHTKNFTSASAQALDEFLSWANNAGVSFSTYGDWLECASDV